MSPDFGRIASTPELWRDQLRHHRFLLVSHATFGSRFYILNILVQCAACDFQWRSLPFCAAIGEFFVGDIHLDQVFIRVDDDFVSVSNQRDRATDLRFGGYVADDETVRAAREATVGH